VVEATLARSDEVDGRIGALLRVRREAALVEADEADRARAAGDARGPLHGLPIAIKDNLVSPAFETTCASKILEGFRSPYEARVLRRLRDAGLVVTAQTNMDEFAMGSSCENSGYQTTRNPWNLDRVPGGSSGGSAAAVACGSVPLALGSDTGGSIRQPAAFCGVVGLKPTYGRVSRYGLVAFASSLDQIGPLSRGVRDAALGLSVISGADPADATCSTRATDDYLSPIEDGMDGIRVGFLREMDSSGLAEDVRSDWDAALVRLEDAGATLQEVSVPNVLSTVAVYYVIANSEASANLARFDGLRYGQRSERAGTLIDLYERSRQEGLGAEVKRRILLGTFALSSGYYDAYYGRARGVLEGLRQQFRSVFSDVDVIVSPTSPTAAFAIGEKVDDPLDMYLQDIFTTAASLAGLPALAVPSGFDREGLPLSLQIMGRPFEEAVVLRVGRAFELAVGGDFVPPLCKESSS